MRRDVHGWLEQATRTNGRLVEKEERNTGPERRTPRRSPQRVLGAMLQRESKLRPPDHLRDSNPRFSYSFQALTARCSIYLHRSAALREARLHRFGNHLVAILVVCPIAGRYLIQYSSILDIRIAPSHQVRI